MELGVGLPNGGATVATEDLVRLATGAEAAGLDSVWVMDRWLRPRHPVEIPGVPVPVELPADGYACVFDPLDVLAHLAALTSRVQLGTSAVLALLQPPVLLARRLATVDQLSRGRGRGARGGLDARGVRRGRPSCRGHREEARRTHRGTARGVGARSGRGDLW
jgi:alkanesulfonate monooxygenase SsuD/methylene tetrahydromethanopterin reductase-like flavin-dependent oxidoreductase (luciferase family)